MKATKLKISDFISIFFRSFFVQAVYNFKGLLSIGVCFALIPVGKRFYTNKEDLQKFMKRHLCFFNAHPYFVSYALGAIAKIEEDIVLSGKEMDEQIEKFKTALIGPLGAIGDQLFWASIKPAAILVGFTGAILLQNQKLKLIFLVVFLILYNFPHLFTRLMGVVRGYRSGYGIYKVLRFENFRYINGIYQGIGGGALGIFCGYFFVSIVAADVVAGFVFVICGATAFLIKKKTKTVYWPVIIPLIITTILGMIIF